MQSVVALREASDRKINGEVAVRPAHDWFGDEMQPQTLIDPLLLDNASQFVLFHLFEHRHNVSALLPFFIERIDFFSGLDAQVDRATVKAKLLASTERGTEANIIVCGDGQTLLNITGVSSRRINLTEGWRRFISQPSAGFLSSELPLRRSISAGVSCRQYLESELPQEEAALDWCTDYVLSARERAFYATQLIGTAGVPPASAVDNRRREWLAGRIAAKDAVRTLLKSEANLQLAPADIEILPDEWGKPRVSGAWRAALGWSPSISISHTAGRAVAIAAGRAFQSTGVDVQKVAPRDTAFEATAFSAGERPLLETSPNRDEGIAAIWAAKEAAGKLFGFGLGQCLADVRVQTADWNTGHMAVSIKGHEEALIPVEITIIDDCVLAVTVLTARTQQLAT